MKTCPICETAYPNGYATCTTDGAMLVPTAELDPGTVIRGKYRIIRTLGKGGMGTVYLAEHLLLGRLRALKFMSGQLSRDPRFLKRFRQEAQAAVELRHPNIVEVMDLDQAEDATPYMAMEFVDGLDLRHLLRSGPLPVSRAIGIAEGVLRGLGAAHARGIVHRDLKPENILLAAAHTPHETAKLADFGIAAMNDAASASSRTLMLTPEYASPEQWRGLTTHELDGRTDLYALGGVFYEMLTGSKPYSASNPEGWMYQHLHFEPAPPSTLRRELASWPGLDALVLTLLAKERDQRIASAEAAIASLESIRQHGPEARVRTGPLPQVKQMPAGPIPLRPIEPQAPGAVPAPAAPRADSAPVARVATGGVATAPPKIDQVPSSPAKTGAVASAAAADPDEVRPARRSVLLALLGLVALLAVGVALAFALPVSALESLAQSVHSPDHPGAALLLYQFACARGDGHACSLVGAAYFNGPGGASDPERAAGYYARACADGDASGCFSIGSDYQTGQGVSQNWIQAATLYERGCDLGDANSCTSLGKMYERGDGVTADPARAAAFYKKASSLSAR